MSDAMRVPAAGGVGALAILALLLIPCPVSAGAECSIDADCEDGLFCTLDLCIWAGTEFAHCEVHGPCGYSLGCVEETQECLCTSDAICRDDLFCNGFELCRIGDPGADANGCVTTGPPCAAGCTCDEGLKACGGGSCTPVDADGDGYGSIATGGTDCDDGDMNRYPVNIEVCDPARHDEDCDFSTLGVRDIDGDGFTASGCCNIDFGGNLICADDCDDNAAAVNPSSPEVCNGIDDNCDSSVDEGLGFTGYLDADSDGWGNAASPASFCALPLTHAIRAGDCDEFLYFVHPNAIELCNGIDDDCDGSIDEGFPTPCS